MKTRTLALFLLLIVLPVYAGGDEFARLYRKYSGLEGVTSIRLPRIVFRIALMVPDLEKAERDLLKCIDRMWILEVDDPELNSQINFADDCRDLLDSGAYEEMVRVREDGEEVRILIRQEGIHFSEMVILVGGNENVMVRMQGRFLMEDLQKIARQASITGNIT